MFLGSRFTDIDSHFQSGGQKTVNTIRWERVVAFGILAGIVWTLLSAAAIAIAGADFMAALPPRRARVGPFLLVANLIAGVWVVWLYAAIRTHYGSGLKTAAVAGTSWWILQSLQSSKWVALGVVPAHTIWGLGIATLPAMLLSAAFGAWCYENFQLRPQSTPPLRQP